MQKDIETIIYKNEEKELKEIFPVLLRYDEKLVKAITEKFHRYEIDKNKAKKEGVAFVNPLYSLKIHDENKKSEEYKDCTFFLNDDTHIYFVEKNSECSTIGRVNKFGGEISLLEEGKWKEFKNKIYAPTIDGKIRNFFLMVYKQYIQ